MNQLERDLIHRRMDKLILNTNYKVLKDECFQRRMLSDVMIDIIEETPEQASRHKRLFEKITKRGPTAFRTLLDICQLHFPTAYKLLEPGNVHKHNKPTAAASTNSNRGKLHSTFRRSVSETAGGGDSNIQTSVLTQQQILQQLSIGSPRSVSRGNDDDDNSSGSENRLQEFTEPVKEKYKVKLTSTPQEHLRHGLTAYPMRSSNRGVVCIVNIITYQNDTHSQRNWAELDKHNLVSLFRQLGFTVFYYQDLINEELMELIKELKTSKIIATTECFAFYLLAHGSHTNGRDKIHLHDASTVYADDILAMFNNINCPVLMHKPKLFFFSICRGELADYGTQSSAQNIENDGVINTKKDPPINMATFSDMLICYSTVPGFAAHREEYMGSWFVKCMCKVWARYAHDTDVDRLMKLVGTEMSTLRTKDLGLQTPAIEPRGFFKLLYLNPGYNQTHAK